MLVGVGFWIPCLVEGSTKPHRGRAMWRMDKWNMCDHRAEVHIECMACGNACEWMPSEEGWNRKETRWSSCGCRAGIECGQHPEHKLAAYLCDDKRDSGVAKIVTEMEKSWWTYSYGDGTKTNGDVGKWGLAEFGSMPPAEALAWHPPTSSDAFRL